MPKGEWVSQHQFLALCKSYIDRKQEYMEMLAEQVGLPIPKEVP